MDEGWMKDDNYSAASNTRRARQESPAGKAARRKITVLFLQAMKYNSAMDPTPSLPKYDSETIRAHGVFGEGARQGGRGSWGRIPSCLQNEQHQKDTSALGN